MNSSMSGGAGTMAAKVSAGSVPMATATSMRPFGDRLSRARLVHASRGARHDVHGGGAGVVVAHPARGRAAAQQFAEVFGGDLLPLPVHAGGARVVDLHAVHAHVALAGAGIARDDAGQGDEAAAVLRPALQGGKLGADRCARLS